ncbi:hypothetical protein OG604_01785 [Streptomyces sp. NBC_01231]|nr:hypothetical protein OG604_01785 [Streptomyces sp. NBC_01231]
MTDADADVPPSEHPMCGWVVRRPRADARTLANAAARFARAERPVMWLGNGCNRSDAGEAALAPAESLRGTSVASGRTPRIASAWVAEPSRHTISEPG